MKSPYNRHACMYDCVSPTLPLLLPTHMLLKGSLQLEGHSMALDKNVHEHICLMCSTVNILKNFVRTTSVPHTDEPIFHPVTQS